ncbi:MAG TPA: hypothetical protein VFV72_02745 [Candidatus Limnocylindrales bacterium]|nr:hypothetical protein [Candidatus Limnocylindrales bacterium]
MAAELGRLRAENEQLQLAHEEVQAAAEEIETLNEEQQAANEELETLNEELQATVEELNTTNDDLQARSVELQESTSTMDRHTRQSDSDRARLERVLDSLETGLALFDPEGQLTVANAGYRDVFDGAVEVLDESGSPLADETAPSARAMRGEAFQSRVQVRRGRRKLGTFDVRAAAFGPDDEGFTLLSVRRVD